MVIGYGRDDNTKQNYWTVVNSHSDWGVDGLGRVLRSDTENPIIRGNFIGV